MQLGKLRRRLTRHRSGGMHDDGLNTIGSRSGDKICHRLKGPGSPECIRTNRNDEPVVVCAWPPLALMKFEDKCPSSSPLETRPRTGNYGRDDPTWEGRLALQPSGVVIVCLVKEHDPISGCRLDLTFGIVFQSLDTCSTGF